MTDPSDVHLTPEQALDLAHGLLGPDGASERVRHLTHVRGCAACGTALAAVEAEGRLLRQRLALAPAPSGLEGRVLDRVRASARARTWVWRALGAAAVVTAAVMGRSLGVRAPSKPQLLVRTVMTSEERAMAALFGEAAK